MEYSVIVGNIGTVHTGRNKRTAMTVYREYVRASIDGIGRGAGENVTLMAGDEPACEFSGLNPTE